MIFRLQTLECEKCRIAENAEKKSWRFFMPFKHSNSPILIFTFLINLHISLLENRSKHAFFMEAKLEEATELLRQAALMTLNPSAKTPPLIASSMSGDLLLFPINSDCRQRFFQLMADIEQMAPGLQGVQIPLEVLDLVDRGMNPDLYTQQCTERLEAAASADKLRQSSFQVWHQTNRRFSSQRCCLIN